jgi:hypothetical protein
MSTLQLDTTDSRRHFALVVPQRAFESPVLFHAIIALSARLRRSDQETLRRAEFHHQECLTNLIPVLDDQGLASDGTILAATVILRMYEVLQTGE